MARVSLQFVRRCRGSSSEGHWSTWSPPATGANIIQTVDRIRDALPQLEAAIPRTINLTPAGGLGSRGSFGGERRSSGFRSPLR
jgi:hypothetical protein